MLSKGRSGKSSAALVVPRIISIYTLCAKHGVQDITIKRLHFNDLNVLLMGFEIAEARQRLAERRQKNLSKNNIDDVVDISPTEAVKLLKGGN